MGLWERFKGYFVTGVLAVVPLAVTVFVFWWIFITLDRILRPTFEVFFGEYVVVGMSLLFTFFIIVFVGLLIRELVGYQVLYYFDRVVERVPFVRELYGGLKQITLAMFARDDFESVVLLEYPRRGLYTIGLITGTELDEIQEMTNEDVISVYVPTSPNPTSGYMLFIPKSELMFLDMEVDEAIRLIISGGFVPPEEAENKLKK
ncbi:DUF502 domain-containing protein [Methanonatronarchaeum sp. AMET-Sl]|uniref:DUF502 domain-containing protein n=1 Tax=Methanonatronarchaeum sp. AMET-Sl TaxID=3037654 RepID=UPI00244DCAFF|nr:DUF502 domain-containing protein [Methanonatronarchaeum sp. AMET-Sl]WGI16886.1 DUF502 domain-containing protein [Methanonatronarchaeum sp. AMET-Sl]